MIIVYEGVFDPPHVTHMWLAQAAAEKADKVIIVPTSNRAANTCSHKEPTDQKIRLEMCKACFKDIPNTIVSDLAINLGLVYSVDIIESLISLYDKKDSWYWLCGSDWLKGLDKFHDLKRFKKLAAFMVIERTGHECKSLKYRKLYFRIHSNLSSTYIRNRVCTNRSIKGLVDSSVEGIISKHRLYT